MNYIGSMKVKLFCFTFCPLWYSLEEDELIRNQFTMALYNMINNMDIEIRDTPV